MNFAVINKKKNFKFEDYNDEIISCYSYFKKKNLFPSPQRQYQLHSTSPCHLFLFIYVLHTHPIVFVQTLLTLAQTLLVNIVLDIHRSSVVINTAMIHII